MKDKDKLIGKKKAMKIINERIGEILDNLKDCFLKNLEQLENFEEKFEVVRELEVIKYRIWNYK